MTRDDRFSMSAVLKYRKNIEEEVAKEASSLKKRLEVEELALKDMESRKESAISCYREKKFHTVEDINLTHHFLTTIDVEIASQKRRVSEMAKDYDRKREDLISAAMDKKIMETMRDREWEGHKRLMWSLEQKNLDEIAVNCYCRNQ